MTPYEYGRRNADLFIGFSLFIMEQAKRHKLQKLFFCTREGVFFKRVYEALFRNNDAYGIETELLHVSRKSVFPSSILTENGPDFSHLFRLYKTHSPRTLLGSLALDSVKLRMYFESADLKFDELAESPSEKKAMKSVLQDPEFIAEVARELEQQCSSVRAYFNARLSSYKRVGLVDIGWRATVLAALGRLYPENSFTGLYLGLAPERNAFGPNCTKFAYGPNFDESRDYIRLLHAIDVPEFICLSEAPTTIGYRVTETGSAVAIPGKVLDTSDSISRFSVPFQEGVIDVANSTSPESLSKDHLSGALRARSLNLWRSLLKQPPQELVDAYFSLRSDEGFGLAEFRDQSEAPTPSEIMISMFQVQKRAQLKRFLVYNQWSNGVKVRKDLGPMRRSFLFGIMKLAEFIKFRNLT